MPITFKLGADVRYFDSSKLIRFERTDDVYSLVFESGVVIAFEESEAVRFNFRNGTPVKKRSGIRHKVYDYLFGQPESDSISN
jgi:hypothetical protein